MPVLAICRGMQLLNVAQGGTLQQHLPSAKVHVQRQADQLPGQHRAVHDVVVAQGSKLATIMGAGKHDVNSRHHQAVDRLGSDLTVTALSIDGVVEAMEVPDRKFAVAVQWHPEDRIGVSESDRKLFESFADALRASAATR
jgi:putative glutamine amidotransferase